MNHHQRGYTLLELMISISVFALIGLACWQVLDRVITTKSVLEQRSDHLRQMQKGLWVMARDLRAVANRPIRDNNGTQEAAISSVIPGFLLMFTRLGWPNPQETRRSTLQRVGYILETDHSGQANLMRYYWPVLDRAGESKPVKQLLVEAVNTLEIQFVDNEGGVQFYWPPTRNEGNEPLAQATFTQSAIPSGIRIRMDINPFGEIERVFSLRDTKAQ